jgi:GT2 family glycosyltransferase
MLELKVSKLDAVDRSTRKAVLVLGMCQSGTSALARVLNLLGLDFPRRLMPPSSENPKSFGESRRRRRRHFRIARSITESGLFDRNWYLDQNPDVRQAGVDPSLHYVEYGAAEGRDPHLLFSTEWYLNQNPDVKRAEVNPLVHYIRQGAKEGRIPHPAFYSDAYQKLAEKSPVTHDLASKLRRDGNQLALRNILIEDYGEQCQKRVFRYFEMISELKGAADKPPARSQMLARHIGALAGLMRRHRAQTVDVSIIVPAFNHVEYSIACLYSILEHDTRYHYEIIIGNNLSADETREVFESVGGIVRVVTHKSNEGFVRNCNLAAREARGRYLVLLNNDTFVLDGWLDNLIEPFERKHTIGLVGSKLLMSDGLLQEAGGIVWRDGSAWNFGRNQDPRLPEFNYVKDVDYVSGASIAMRTETWSKVGGFDERYMPAYCEDSDLAFTLRALGLQTVYQPFSTVIHHEGVTHGTDTGSGVKQYQIKNTKEFTTKWRHVITKEHFDNGSNVFLARDRSANRKHILILDHYVPQFDKDAGSRSIFEYTKLFVDAGFHVTFWPENLYYDRPYTRVLQSIGVEVIYGWPPANQLDRWVTEHGQHLDYALLSRANVSSKAVEPLRAHSKAKILFYGHDIGFLRLEREFHISGNVRVMKEAAYSRDVESMMWKACDVICYPAREECEYVRARGTGKSVIELPVYIYDEKQLNTTTDLVSDSIDEVARILFVAGFQHPPNRDGILWFCKECLTEVQRRVPGVELDIVGSSPPPDVQSLASTNVHVHGFVSDHALEKFYRSSTVSIAPLRFGAGVKGKVIEALRYGLPLVTTSTGAQGLAGGEGICEIADGAEEFVDAVVRLLKNSRRRAVLAKRGLEFVAKYYSRQAAITALSQEVPEMKRLLVAREQSQADLN